MVKKSLAIGLCACFLLLPLTARAGTAEAGQSKCWSDMIHEENSIRASLLYLPYMILSGPVCIIDAIIYPKPTTQSTIPPPAHKVAP